MSTEKKTTITVEGSLLPQVIIVTGPTDLEFARKCARSAIDELRATEMHNLANDLHLSLTPFLGHL